MKLQKMKDSVRNKVNMVNDISSIMMRLEDQGYFD